MRRILVSSDWHLDAHTAGVPRLEEFGHYLDRLGREARQGIDLFLFLGDAFDPGGMLQAQYTCMILDAARQMRTYCEQSIWIAGNHDVIETSRCVTTLSPLAVVFRDCPRTHVVEIPRTVQPFEGLSVLALPYTARAVERPRFMDTWREAFAAAQGRKAGLVVASHMTVPGAVLGSESKEMSRGRDIDLPEGPIRALNPDLVLNGHYHRHQVVKREGFDVVIPGSPARFTFGERHDDQKGYLVVEVPDA